MVSGSEVGIEYPMWTDSGIFCFFHRGFVHTVRLTLSAWMEHGPAVVRSQPIARVELSDRSPEEAQPDRVDRCRWRAAPEGARLVEIVSSADNLLPRNLYRKMSGRVRADLTEYSSAEAALVALSDGCLAWARLSPESR
jgi:hypothetical protein